MLCHSELFLSYFDFNYFTGTLYYAYIKHEDTLELITDGKETRLNCYASIQNQPFSIVGSYYKLIPAANKLAIPDVDVHYPSYEIINNTKVAKDPIVCTSGEKCKVIVIFSGR